MCTLACWIGVHPRAPLVIAANRDERLSRASTGPMLWPGTPTILAPRDEVAGGSWWAVNAHGLFVGLTNRAGASIDDHRRSRGQLVIDMARSESVGEAESRLRELEPESYNGFHLIATDGKTGVIAVNTGAVLTLRPIGPGQTIISERSFGAAPVSRDAQAAEVLSGTPSPEVLEKLLGTHLVDPFQSLCVHLPQIEYGTRSSTILALGAGRPLLRWAGGPPCVTPWEDRSGLLADALNRP